MRHKRVVLLAVVGLFFWSATFSPRSVYAGDATGWQVVLGVLGAGYLFGDYSATKQKESTNRYALGLQRDVEMARIHANYAKVAASAHGGSGTTNVSSPWGSWKGESSVAQDNYGRRSYTDVQRAPAYREMEPPPDPKASPPKKVFRKEEKPSPIPRSVIKERKLGVQYANYVPGRDEADLQTLEYVYSHPSQLSVQERVAVSVYLDGLKNPGKYDRATFETYKWDVARAIDKVM